MKWGSVTPLDSQAIVQNVIKRFEAAKSKKALWEPLYRDCMDYLAPHRQTFNVQTEGQSKTNADRVFDSTAVSALDDFVSNLVSAMTPHRKRWMKLIPGYMVEDQSREKAAAELEKITYTYFQHLHMSNFHTEFATSLSDLGVGTAALLLHKGTKSRPFNFEAVPISEIYLERGPYGRIDTAFRYFKEDARNVQQVWPDAEFTDDLLAQFEKTPEQEHCFIEGTLAGEYTFKEMDAAGKVTEVKRYGYRYVVMHEATKTLIVNRVQRSSPWVIFRWSTLTGEIYGRGPALKALPDTKSINVTKELLLKGANRSILGIWLVQDDGVINFENLKQLKPGMVIPVDYTSGDRAGLVELPFNGNPNLAQFVFNDMQIAIKRMMFSEPLGRVDLPVKSVYELQSRQQEWARRIGSPFGRLEYECLIPLIRRGLYILNELGLIDMAPFTQDGEYMGIDFVSPLAQSQDLEDLQAIDAYLTGNLQTLGQEMAMAMTKMDKVAQHRARLLGVPLDMVPTQQEFDQMKQAAAQQAALQTQQQVQQVMAEGQALNGQPGAQPV